MPLEHSRWVALSLGVVLALLTPLNPEAVAGDREPVPKGATLSVETDKQEYLLGERVVLQLKLTNTDPLPFTIVPTTWQRFAVRDECVSLSMTDADSHVAWDPFPERLGGGGPVGHAVTLAKGESWDEKLDLWRYRIPDHAGTWRIRVSRDFWWKETPERPIPSAELVLRFREPTVEEAGKVLDGLAANVDRPLYYSAAYPIYIPLLEERASAGLVAATEGLALDRDLAATRALLRLFASKNRAVANRAGDFLAQRIRVPVKKGDGEGLGYRYMIRAFVNSLEDMVPSWRPEFEAEARAAARAFLAGEGLPVAGSAADVLHLLGTPEDGPAVSTGLDRFALLFEKKAPPGSTFKELTQQEDIERDGACLLSTCRVLFHRGLQPVAKPEGAGDALLWLHALSYAERENRPSEWQDILRVLAAHPRALVRREVAAYCRGEERNPVLRQLKEVLQADPDERVRKAAKGDR